MLTLKLVNTLVHLNNTFGKGDIESITINMKESKPCLGEWFGTVKRRFPHAGGDERMFKVEDRVLTFLSHRRKVDL